MTLFFDRNLGKSIPEALKLLGLEVEKHDDHFPANATDEEWLEHVGNKGWPVVTADARLRLNQSQLRALADYRVGCFMLCGAGNRPRWYAVRIIARNWEHIEIVANSGQRPFLHRLYLKQPPRCTEVGL